eukprot:SAG31_NODE_36595_length_312_cov_0.605634_1_plen_48_part_01
MQQLLRNRNREKQIQCKCQAWLQWRNRKEKMHFPYSSQQWPEMKNHTA